MADAATNGAAAKTSASKRRSKKSNATNALEPSNPSPAERVVPVEDTLAGIDGDDKATDTPQIRETLKNIRNVTKKLAGTAKVDAIIAEHPGVSLDDLVAQRKINVDQKAQAVKKPQLEDQLKSLEKQLADYRKIEDDFQARLLVERERLGAAHKKELESLQSELTAQSASAAGTDFREKLLLLSKFLRAAAARRAMDDDNSEESKAFEGLLLLVYGGDNGAADAAEKLIEGASDTIPSTEGDMLSVSYEQVKALSLEYVPPYSVEEAWVNGVAEAQGHEEPATDPTIAHAGLTEVKTDMAATQPVAVDVAETAAAEESPAGPAPQQADIGDAAANTAANDQWDPAAPGGGDIDASWVSVPRPPEETDQSGIAAASNDVKNWADEQPSEPQPAPAASQTGSDGFREVHHGRGGRGRAGYSQDHRGRGRGGGFRGDGRGRGPYRGDRGGFRSRGRGGGGGQRGRGDGAAA